MLPHLAPCFSIQEYGRLSLNTSNKDCQAVKPIGIARLESGSIPYMHSNVSDGKKWIFAEETSISGASAEAFVVVDCISHDCPSRGLDDVDNLLMAGGWVMCFFWPVSVDS